MSTTQPLDNAEVIRLYLADDMRVRDIARRLGVRTGRVTQIILANTTREQRKASGVSKRRMSRPAPKGRKCKPRAVPPGWLPSPAEIEAGKALALAEGLAAAAGRRA